MKTIDVSKRVMEKVVAYEKVRTRRWILRFILVLFVLTVFELSALALVAQDVAQKQSLELLTLFTQDREIIAEFWQDTLTVFWEELPQQAVVLAAVLLAGMFVIVVVTRGRRRVIRARLSKLANYGKNRDNISGSKKEDP